MNNSLSFPFMFGVMAILIISGCTQQQPNVNQMSAKQTPVEQPTIEQPIIKISSGNYIVDSKGKTLYLFTKDVMGDSNCTGSCLTIWPVFYQEKIAVSSGLEPSDFGTISRDDGNKQTTYKGWPLYYFTSDVNPGDIKGEGINKIWFIARPDYAVFIADKDNKKFIVNANGISLYNFTNDKPGVSNCTGDCLNMSVFYDENIVAPSIMNATDFGVIINSKGSKQTTYKQMPLYYFVNDTKRGNTNGQGVNNAWFVVNPEATLAPVVITPTPVATQTMEAPTPDDTETMAGGGSCGY